MSSTLQAWENRIVKYGSLPANQFLAHELNARRHPGDQREALRGLLGAVGWIGPVIVSERSGKLLDGHARVEETLSRDELAMIPFVEVRVTEEEERLILATFDPIGALADHDREQLDLLLEGIETESAGLQRLLESLGETDPGAFAPNTAPETSTAQTSANDVETARAKLADQFSGENRNLVNMLCPHCCGEFQVDRTALG